MNLWKSTFRLVHWLGLAGFVAGTALWLPALSFYKDSEFVTGQVAEIVERQDVNGGISRYPLFNYLDKNGAIHNASGAPGAAAYNYQPGQTVRLRYRRGDPDDARLDNFRSLWGMPILVQGLGLVWMFLGSLLAPARSGSAQPPSQNSPQNTPGA